MSADLNDLTSKSILFEIVNRKNPSIPVESYILNVPPSSIDIDEPHRISRTKTWGGLFVDDYGPDNPVINISGDTGGMSVRKTLALNAGDNKFNGKTAFYFLRDRIMRYKGRISNYEEYDLVMYDLSSGSQSIELADTVTTGLVEGYICSLDNFKMTRSKDRPLFYGYNIQLIALRVIGQSTDIANPPVSSVNPLSIIVGLRKGLNTVKTAFSKVQAIYNQATAIADLLEEVTAQITGFFDRTADIFVYPVSLVKRYAAAVKTMMEDIRALNEVTMATISEIEEEVWGIHGIITEIAYGSAALVTYGKTTESTGGEILVDKTIGTNTQSLESRYESETDSTSQIYKEILDNDITETDNNTVYGYKVERITATTTLEGLSTKYFGDTSQIFLIAQFNDLQGDDDLTIGGIVKIPVIFQSGIPDNNYIYDLTLTDVYGTDIRVESSTGALVIAASGDFATISGLDNYIQSLNSRLNSTLGERLRLTVYGIRSSIGNASNNTYPLSYILANIKDTVNQDPRTVDVDDIKVRGVGDQLFISFKAKTIKFNDIIPYSGGI